MVVSDSSVIVKPFIALSTATPYQIPLVSSCIIHLSGKQRRALSLFFQSHVRAFTHHRNCITWSNFSEGAVLRAAQVIHAGAGTSEEGW